MRRFATMMGLTLVLGVGLLSGAALAEAQETWHFDESSGGEDVHWVSDTAVDPGADAFDVSWEITLVEVTVYYIMWEFIVDVTEDVPEEQRIGRDVVDGPAPVVVFDDQVVYPEPPEEPGVAARLVLGINATGNGYLDVTEVVLGQVTVELPGFGEVTVDVTNIRIAGDITAEAIYWVVGDMDCDGDVDFDDIDPFVLALGGEEGYLAQHPYCNWYNADADGNGTVDFNDIDAFVALIGS